MEQKKINSSNYYESFWTKAIELTIIASVIIVPIVFHPHCVTFFLPAKEFAAAFLIIIGLMLWGLKMVNKEEFRFAPTHLNLPLLSFIAICGLSLIWSNNFFISLKELPLFIAGPCLYFVVTNNIYKERQVNHILNVLIFIGTLFGIYGIFQYNDMEIFTFWQGNVGRQRVFGLFGNVNYFAEYLIVPLSIAVPLFLVTKNRIRKILLLIGILTMGLTLIFTFTRGSYLGFGVAVIFMFFLFLLSRGKSFIKENKNIFIIVLIVIIIFTCLLTIPTPLNKPGTTISKLKERVSITKLGTEFSFGRRIAIWKFTGMMIKDRPLLGSGIGTFKYNTLRYQANFFEQGDNRSLYPHGFADKAHNEYLQLWAELGIVGLAIFLWFMIAYFYRGIKYLKKEKNEYLQGIVIGLMASVMAVLVDALFGFPFHLPATIVLFWLAIGLTMVITKANSIKVRGENNFKQEGYNKKEEKNREKQSDNKIDNNRIGQSNIYRFKPILYIVIILLAIFLSFTVFRPFRARIFWHYGIQEIESNNLNKAIKVYEQALRWDPYLGQAYYDIGKILEEKEFYNLSLKYFAKASKYIDHPKLPDNFAYLFLKLEQLDNAVLALKSAISYQSDKKSMVPWYSELGNTYLQLARYNLAEEAFKNALKINPNFFNAHYGLGGTYLRQNRIDEALSELQEVIEIAPDSQQAKYARDIIQQITQEKLKVPSDTSTPAD